MLDMLWYETGLLPVGAVEGEILEQQQVDDAVREGLSSVCKSLK